MRTQVCGVVFSHCLALTDPTEFTAIESHCDFLCAVHLQQRLLYNCSSLESNIGVYYLEDCEKVVILHLNHIVPKTRGTPKKAVKM